MMRAVQGWRVAVVSAVCLASAVGCRDAVGPSASAPEAQVVGDTLVGERRNSGNVAFLAFAVPVQVRNVVTTCLDKILVGRAPQEACEYVKQTISDLLMNKLDLSLLVITKVGAVRGRWAWGGTRPWLAQNAGHWRSRGLGWD